MTDLSPSADVAPSGRKPLQILLIEDDARWRTWVEAHVESVGHRAVSAADGQAGLQAIAKAKPDVVLCDIEMPVLNGYGVLEALRKDPATADVPFIFLTSRNARSDQRRGMVLGADDYLAKPFSGDELLAAITAVMRKRAALTDRLRQYTEEYRRELAAPWAHELLTPLNGILGIAAMLEAEPEAVSAQELRELARSIHESARRQQALARKLVQYFQLEQLREYNWADPASAVEAGAGIEDEVLGVMERAGRAADLRLECARAAVKISPQWLRAVAAELSENACRFSAKGTPVTVTARIVEGLYRIEVTDQGPGMTPAERSAIAAFRQFDRAKREQQGLGLGLAIVRNVARLHRGSFSLEPGPNGTGLRAVVELPLAD